MQLTQNIRNLRRIIPISRFQSILNSSHSCNSMDGERLFFVEIAEKLHNFQQITLRAYHFVLLDNLSEQHLANSNHATPSSIGDVRSCFIGQLWETCPISEPYSILEDLNNLLLNLLEIFLCNLEAMAKDEQNLSWLQKVLMAVLLQIAHKFESSIVGHIVDLLAE